ERLDKAAELGFVPVDVRQGDPVEQIRELRRARPGTRRPGEEEMGGVMAGIDAVGFQARDRRHPDREDPRQVINDLARLVNPPGGWALPACSPLPTRHRPRRAVTPTGRCRYPGRRCSTKASPSGSGARTTAGTPRTC